MPPQDFTLTMLLKSEWEKFRLVWLECQSSFKVNIFYKYNFLVLVTFFMEYMRSKNFAKPRISIWEQCWIEQCLIFSKFSSNKILGSLGMVPSLNFWIFRKKQKKIKEFRHFDRTRILVHISMYTNYIRVHKLMHFKVVVCSF